VCGEFLKVFLDHFFSWELRESKAGEFMNLKQRIMSVKEYTLKFTHLSRYSPELAGNMRALIRKFASGLSDDLVLECKGEILNRDMDFSKLCIHM